MSETSHIPKAILYYNPSSIWSACGVEEKGYGEDELERKIVDLGKAENLSLSFLRINPQGTVPTLVVPLEKTLAPDDDHRYKAVTDTKSVLEFLDKSRSAISRTHTVSSAPAPALAPATIALSSTASVIIDLLHSDDASPKIRVFNYASQSTLKRTAETLLPFFSGRRDAISSYITASQNAQIQASERTRKLWDSKKVEADFLVTVFGAADKEDAALSPEEKAARDEYRATANDRWSVKLKKALVSLNKEITGPFSLGDQVSIVDLHLAPWLARIAFLCDGLTSDDGDTIVAKIETRIGGGFTLPKDFQSVASPTPNQVPDPSLEITPGAKRVKLAAFWDEMKQRSSWKKVYGESLF
ncbi:uncharacterized protein FOMMEDRAFT_140176 [Fomitiporia mediterranea MF3/22]|uniref:uncharacterized protein n=1 Tax=Fomitiporia mediterranea (strain MF3/22) TaxID=694068 RepID=UPI000440818F|nr:uncharacterized protein FOMMEDRAFT_140176 [Fomitiporia mediterranea MF3/22]EJD04111.1 hypothetical protein FOMMEDRAFT_140176 [Fomitiporia mediterranea MF3/22]